MFCMYRFPRDPCIHDAWLKVVQRQWGGAWQPVDADVVCSSHFLTQDFIVSRGKSMLKESAIPKIEYLEHVVSFLFNSEHI